MSCVLAILTARVTKIEWFAKAIGMVRKHSQERYFQVLQSYIGNGNRWLDIGCGRQIVPDFAASFAEQKEMVGRTTMFVGIDTDSAITEHPLLKWPVAAVGQHLPFRDNSFDVVTANMVFEHLETPQVVLEEVRRVLAPSGKLIFHTPNLRYPYIFAASLIHDSLKKRVIRFLERRSEQDVFTTFYRANTVQRIRDLARAGQLEVYDLAVGPSIGSLERLGPIGMLELLFLKVLSCKPFRGLNATIIAVLSKPPSGQHNRKNGAQGC
jgi:ubiquinone/menaquinone biosynthesis C-methylase UbiE